MLASNSLDWPQIEISLRHLGLVGPVLVVLVGALLVAACWILYLVLKFEDRALEFGVELLRGILSALLKELTRRMSHPALRIEKFLLFFYLVCFLLCALFLLVFQLTKVDAAGYFAILGSCFLLTLFITGFQSGSYAKHLLN
jgi:hypothetical protein